MMWLARAGGVEIEEMYRVFNMGMGMLLVVSQNAADYVLEYLQRDLPHTRIVGHLKEGKAGVEHAQTAFVE